MPNGAGEYDKINDLREKVNKAICIKYAKRRF